MNLNNNSRNHILQLVMRSIRPLRYFTDITCMYIYCKTHVTDKRVYVPSRDTELC